MLLILFLKVEIEHTFVFPKNNVAYWGKMSNNNIAFRKSALKTSLKHLIQNCYFMVGNSLLRQKIGIPTGTDSTRFFGKSLFIHP